MISMGSLSLIQEIDVTQLEDFQKVHLEVFKDQLSTTIQLSGPTIGATTCTAAAVAKASGVLFTNAPGIIPDSQDPQRPIDQPVPAPPISGTSGSQPLPEKRKRSKKIYMCHQCSKEFPKKTDYDDHMAKYHKVGSLDLTCSYCGKELSAKRSLNTHVRTMHIKSFKYPCPVLNCDWRTDAKGLLTTHMVKKHGEEPNKEYRCDLCHKLFDGDNLLKRHEKAAMCQVTKNFECTQCAPPQVVQIEGKDGHPHQEVPHK